MSQTINVAFVQQFEDNVHTLAQQMASKFRGTVREKSVTAKYDHFERIGAVEMVKRTTRHGNTPLIDTPHSRRRLLLDDFEVADLVDKQDEIRLLISPASEYAQNFARALNRRFDDSVIAAFNADSVAVDESDATSAITLASFLSGAHIIAAGAAPLTIAKLRSAKKLLDNQDVEGDDRYFATSPDGIEDLLATTEVTSSDYNTVKALSRGEVDTFLGFKFIMTTRLPKVSTTRTCFAWQKAGIGVGIGKDMATRISERDDKSYATQVYSSMTLGATRIEEARVVAVEITE